MNEKIAKSDSVDALEKLAKISKLSITLNRLKFNSPNDLKTRKRHFSASATEKNPRSALKASISASSRIVRPHPYKKQSPRKIFKQNSPGEKKRCPVQGCNSTGHISGLTSRHWSYETCPLYWKITNDATVQKSIESSPSDSTDNNNNNNSPNTKADRKKKKYKESFNQKLNDIIYLESESKAKKSTKSTILKPEVFSDIQNLSISFLVNSIASDLTTPSLFSKKSSESSLKEKIESPYINDLKVSKFEFELFQQSIVDSAKTKEIITDTNEVLNPTSYLKLTNKSHKIVKFGDFEIESWFKSPYPEEICQLDRLFICQYCLKYMKSSWILNRHLEKCLWKHPPGREIYRKDIYSFWEVDGKLNKIYCQNLCLLGKLFIDQKTLYFDVEPFLFYVLTHFNSSTGTYEMIGYFSKEKECIRNYNLSCILTLPQYMHKGFGKLLIDFSYLLTRAEGKVGSPETPLSDLGLISYRNYWISTLLNKLTEYNEITGISIKDLSIETGIAMNDIISTFQYLGLIKYWKGKYVIKMNQELMNKYIQKKRSAILEIDQKCLRLNIEQKPSQEVI